jgi:hypothetical protein
MFAVKFSSKRLKFMAEYLEVVVDKGTGLYHKNTIIKISDSSLSPPSLEVTGLHLSARKISGVLQRTIADPG